MRCNRYISTNTPACVPAEKHPIMPPSNISPLLVAPARVPPLLFSVSLSAHQRWVWNKEPSGHSYLPAQVGLYTEKTASLQHLSAWIKDVSVYPVNSPSRFLSPSLLPSLSTSRSHTCAAKTSHTLDRKQTKCSRPPPSSCLSPPLCHFSSPSGCPRLLCFLFSAFLDNCFPLCIMRET